MAELEVGIGETSSYRYFGIKPPIDDQLVKTVTGRLELPYWVGDFQTVYVQTATRDDCPDHTLLGVEAGTAIDVIGEDDVNEGTLNIANQIVRVLKLEGNQVTLHPEITTTDFQTPLFGDEYYETLETLSIIADRKSS